MTKVTQAHIDARTGAIQHAALRTFARKGFERTTMAEIAEEAGISAGAIYRYFEGKSQLLQSVFEAGTERSRLLFAEAGVSAPSAIAALEQVALEALLDQGLDADCLELEFVLAGARDPEGLGQHHAALRQGVVDAAKRMVRDGQEAGEIRTDIDGGILALMGVALVTGLRMIRLERGDGGEDVAALRAFFSLVTPPGRGQPEA